MTAGPTSGHERPAPAPGWTTREACPGCGSGSAVAVWSGRLHDDPCGPFLRDLGYSVDVVDLLGHEQFAYVRCERCELTYHRHVLDDAGLDALYNSWISREQIDAFEARHLHGDHSRFDEARTSVKHLLRLRRLIDDPAPRLLDFGCGDGAFATMAAAFGFRAFGVDASAARAAVIDQSAVPVFADLAALDAAGGGRFDVITLFQVLEHLPRPVELLTALHARLRPGGILVVEVPDATAISRPKNLVELDLIQPLEHINGFTPKTLVSTCERVGFRVIRRPAAHVTTSWIDIGRGAAGALLRQSVTNRYFRRTA